MLDWEKKYPLFFSATSYFHRVSPCLPKLRGLARFRPNRRPFVNSHEAREPNRQNVSRCGHVIPEANPFSKPFDSAVGLVLKYPRPALIIGGHAGEEMKDPSVFLVAVLNCFWPDGTINRDRLWREVRYLVRFLSSLLIAIIVFIGISTAPIVWVHTYMVPIPIVAKIFSVFDLDEETWEENVFTGQAGEVVKEYEAWRKDQGMSRQTSLNLQKFLWHSWYTLVAYGLYLVVLFYLLLMKVSHSLFFNYKRQVLSRERAYCFRNREYKADGESRQVQFGRTDCVKTREGGTDSGESRD